MIVGVLRDLSPWLSFLLALTVCGLAGAAALLPIGRPLPATGEAAVPEQSLAEAVFGGGKKKIWLFVGLGALLVLIFVILAFVARLGLIQRIQTMEEEHQQTIAALHATHAEEVAQLNARHREEVDGQADRYDRQIEALRERQEQQTELTDLRTQMQMQQLQDQMEEMQEEHEEKVEEYEEQIEEFQQQIMELQGQLLRRR